MMLSVWRLYLLHDLRVAALGSAVDRVHLAGKDRVWARDVSNVAAAKDAAHRLKVALQQRFSKGIHCCDTPAAVCFGGCQR